MAMRVIRVIHHRTDVSGQAVIVLFLIDSNIAIASDPLGVRLEAGAESALQFLRLATTHHHDLRTHPASRLDFDRIKDGARRSSRLTLFERYTPLSAPPSVTDEQLALLGTPAPRSNDDVDHQLLAAIIGDAAEYLVSEDQGLHHNARRLGVAGRVLTLADAIAMLHALHADLPAPPPAVRRVKTHELRIADPIFDSLKEDYPGFVDWFKAAARNQRDALVVDGHREHAAIAILKREPGGAFGILGPLLKICTFKVGSGYSGQKYGELLLKAIFQQAHAQGDSGLYVTVFERHEQLLELLEDFGFEPLDTRTGLGELIYFKPRRMTTDQIGLDPLRYHVRYGPPALALQPDRTFLVPIEPRWHRTLFPDAEPNDGALLPATAGLVNQPFGNALRKAYLCNSPTRLLQPGDTLLFYRSGDEKAVFVVGVCETVEVSPDAEHIAATVGRRTVYSLPEIRTMASKGNLLALMFRQDRLLHDSPITLEELVAGNVVRSWPQSITRTRPEGAAWLKHRLDA